jgi:cellulose synthase/poly-beta-1,6-N-acetylglucosamine synthase-like glycosyltransferase
MIITILGAIPIVVIWLTVIDIIATLRFLRTMRTPKPDPVPDTSLPKAAILLGFRGADPDLLPSLKRLFRQNYPDYEVHIVAENESDPALDVARQAIAETGATNVHLDTYKPDPSTGSISCNKAKQLQALQKLDESVQVIVLGDGDLYAHADCLRDLITPMVLETSIGATWGNRWFVPARNSLGSAVRALINVGSVISMNFLNMPWGGCMAVRRSVIRELNLLPEWSRNMVLDGALPGQLRKAGFRVEFLPYVMMPNREECTLAFCHNFYRRQMLWTRLYHYNWLKLFFIVFQRGITLPLAFAAILIGFITGAEHYALATAFCLLIYLINQWLTVLLIFRALDRVLHEPEARGWLTFSRYMACLPMVLLATAMITSSTFCATFFRKVRWRGMLLDVHSPTDIRAIGDEGMEDLSQRAKAQQSL